MFHTIKDVLACLVKDKSLLDLKRSLWMGDPQSGALFISLRLQAFILPARSKINDFLSRTGGSRNRM